MFELNLSLLLLQSSSSVTMPMSQDSVVGDDGRRHTVVDSHTVMQRRLFANRRVLQFDMVSASFAFFCHHFPELRQHSKSTSANGRVTW